jgi:hypothetical protein
METSEIWETSAVCRGSIVFTSKGQDADATIVQKGVIWNESKSDIQTPSLSSNNRNVNPYKEETDSFWCNLTNLNPDTQYFVRAFVKVGKTESIYVYGDIKEFTTKNSERNTQVRLKKDIAYKYMTEMAIVDEELTDVFAYYDFGTDLGASPYYEMPAGLYYPVYYSAYSEEEDWYLCFSYSCNFQAGRKYTVVCDDFDTDFVFHIIDDGTFSSSSASAPPSTTMSLKIPEHIKYHIRNK